MANDVDRKDLRVIGLSVLGSAIVFLIYDIIPLVVENDPKHSIIVKMIAFTVAIIVGGIFIKLIPKIQQLRPLHLSIIVGASCGIVIGGGLLLYIMWTKSVGVVTESSGTDLNGVASLITGLSTVGLVIILIWQTKNLKKQTEILQKQTQLGSRPKIFPRYVSCVCPCGVTYIRLYNVGKGNAIDIHLEFKDANDQPLGYKIDRYSLLTVDIETPDGLGNMRQELVDTGIWFTGNVFRFKIEGWYRDTNEETISANGMYQYPPKIEQ